MKVKTFLLLTVLSIGSVGAELVSVSLQTDKTAVQRGGVATFTATVANTDTNQVTNIACTASYTDPSTGQLATAVSNTVTITRLGWTVAAPVVKIPVNDFFDVLLDTIKVDGTAVPGAVTSGYVTITLPSLDAGKSKAVQFQAKAK